MKIPNSFTFLCECGGKPCRQLIPMNIAGDDFHAFRSGHSNDRALISKSCPNFHTYENNFIYVDHPEYIICDDPEDEE